MTIPCLWASLERKGNKDQNQNGLTG